MENTPINIAKKHEKDIIHYLSTEQKIPVGECQLLYEETFLTQKNTQSYCFMILHTTGFYGVNATLQKNGTLGEYMCTKL